MPVYDPYSTDEDDETDSPSPKAAEVEPVTSTQTPDDVQAEKDKETEPVKHQGENKPKSRPEKPKDFVPMEEGNNDLFIEITPDNQSDPASKVVILFNKGHTLQFWYNGTKPNQQGPKHLRRIILGPRLMIGHIHPIEIPNLLDDQI